MMMFFSKPLKSCFRILFLLLAFLYMIPTAHSQVVNETTKKKVSIGVGMFTDIWLKEPEGIRMRTINQGVNVFALYNVPFGKSPVGLSLGLGIRVHNAYGNFIVEQSKINDTTKLIRIPDTVGYKRSKMTMVYLDVPVEFFVKTKVHVNMALGFKLGILLSSHTKYVGDGRIKTNQYQFYQTDELRLKLRVIPNLEQFTYGPYFRIGYKWINADCFYMLSTIFNTARGPEMYPISVGLVLMPF
ncbi:MAG: outer membrane beta-barrel protein [Bacteroidetes bacterium]|nr:outer membrane beta-barrel protein [Bacteroidota bacterium]